MRALTALTAVVLSGLFAAPASAWILIGADATQDPGQIALLVWGSGSFTAVDVTERVDGAEVPVRTVVPPTVTAPDGEFSGDYYPRSATWRCDRLTRTFNAAGRRADGSVETATFTLRTPSCRNRLTLTAPRKVRPGARVTLRVRDRFKLGGISPRLCIRDQRCRALRIPAGRSVATYSFRPRGKGLRRLSLRSRWQRLSAVVAVGVRPPAGARRLPVVLTTGDSLMQSTDAILGDRLTDRARVRTDVFIGSKISRASPVDWADIPRRQLRFEPAATVIFLGTNEGWPMKTPAGAEVTCCGEPWIAEYTRRARTMMRTYLDGGKRALVWLNVPIPRNDERKPIAQAVNVGLARAVQGLDRAAVVDAAEIFTPGGVYRDAMTHGGRTVRVRESDGVHLSPDGAAIAVRAVIEQLERFGVV